MEHHSLRDPSSKKVELFLSHESKNLNNILTKVKELDELNQKLAHYLEPNLSKYCQVANRIGNRLVILTANASIATQLRFQGIDLLRKFKQEPILQKIQEIHCKVRPPFESTRRFSPKKIPLLSTETAKVIRDIASTLKDAKLKEIMDRIAKHTESI